MSKINQILSDIASQKSTAVQITQSYLDRIAKYNPTLNAYAEVYPQRALQRAAAVDQGTLTGPLAGVPIAIKDNLCTPYGHTTCSSKILENFKSPYMATAVQKLEDAGAIILGKTILDEFAMGSSTENSAFNPTKNPWDTSRVPGGSSGGSAAAMAAQLAAVTIGSDTGGSIRQPAAYCGVVGLKPTYGRISRWGLVAFASSLDQIGPFTSSVEDAATILAVLSGHDEKDSTSAPGLNLDFNTNLHQGVEGLKIGIAEQYMSDDNAPQIQKAIQQAIEIYKKAGAQIVPVQLPHTRYGIPTYYVVATAEASSNLARYDGIRYGLRAKSADDLIDLYSRSRAQGLGPEVQRRIMLGTYVLSSGYYDAYYLRALKVRRLIKNDFDHVFNHQCDAILCPTTTSPAFKFGQNTDNPLAMYLNDIYTVTANLAGIPGISLPAGFAQLGDKKLPLGIQLLGPHFQEAKLLQIAQTYQAHTKHHLETPDLT